MIEGRYLKRSGAGVGDKGTWEKESNFIKKITKPVSYTLMEKNN